MRGFNAERKAKIVEMRRQGKTYAEIEAAVGCSSNSVAKILREAGAEMIGKYTPPTYVPTEDEIQEGAERIRAGWDEDEAAERAGAYAPQPWSPPVVASVGTVKGRNGQGRHAR